MQELAEPRIPKNVKNGQMVSYGDDSAVMATFSEEFVKNDYKSEVEGRAIYEKRIQVLLEYPGNNLSNFVARFSEEEGEKGNQWTERFPGQWRAFKAQKTQMPDGMPVEIWSPLDKGRVFSLKAMNIHTVEQIAALTDMTGPNIGMDWRKLQTMAKATIEPNESLVAISKMARENDDLKSQMEVLQNQVQQLASLGTVDHDALLKKNGRKPKQLTENGEV